MFIYRYGTRNQFKAVATTDWSAGQVVVLGKIVAICHTDIPTGTLVGLDTMGVFEGDATAADTWAVGDALYVTSAGVLTKTSTSNTFIGYAENAKATGQETARVFLVQRSPA